MLSVAYRGTKESNFLRNPHCLSPGSDSLYLRFKLTIWALNYPRKHTNYATSLQKRHFWYHYVMQKRISSI